MVQNQLIFMFHKLSQKYHFNVIVIEKIVFHAIVPQIWDEKDFNNIFAH